MKSDKNNEMENDLIIALCAWKSFIKASQV